MKSFFKLNVATTVLLSCFIFVSCNQAEMEKLKSENAELQSEYKRIKNLNSLKDSTFNDIMKEFNDIEANLSEIKQREKGLVSKKVSRGDLSSSAKDRIITDIKAINLLLAENREKISSLNSKLSKSNLNLKEFERMMVSLQESVEQKDAEIGQLRENLANANDALAALNDLYIESVMEAEARREELNKAFYAFGSFKELKENNVLTKEGGLVGIGATKTLKSDFNKSYFKEIDIQETFKIQLFSNKAKMVSTHPSESYELELIDNAYTLNIKDAKAFWSVSKYLVVITE